MLTARQQEIWQFLAEYVDDHGYPPTVREIGDAVGLASPSTVHAHLANLERAGLLRRDPTKPRALELVGRRKEEAPAARAPETPVLPLVGRIAAGGAYCLEDWGWSHEPGHETWADEPALSNLVFELTVLMRSTRNLVAMIETHPVVSFVTRGAARIDRIELDHLLQLRGRRLPLI